ncbi:hypothetical protein C9890_0236, partial [Perkinsus sp. BL_2016]
QPPQHQQENPQPPQHQQENPQPPQHQQENPQQQQHNQKQTSTAAPTVSGKMNRGVIAAIAVSCVLVFGGDITRKAIENVALHERLV